VIGSETKGLARSFLLPYIPPKTAVHTTHHWLPFELFGVKWGAASSNGVDAVVFPLRAMTHATTMTLVDCCLREKPERTDLLFASNARKLSLVGYKES
jgi:hypothetical protein